MFKRMVAVVSVALFLAAIPLAADQWDKKTKMTFSQPVEIPGMVLPAGTYVFRLADSNSNRHIVQVFNEEENHVFATILAIPNYRIKPTGDTVVHFQERAADAPEAVKAWFYPADNFGQEFVYPKVRAGEIAKAAQEPVLAGEVTPQETPKQLEETPVVAVTPEKKEIEVAQVVTKPPVETAVAAPAPVAELPKTASPVPMAALFGIFSLSLAGAARLFRR
jgi:hypothetical protein